MNTATDGLQLVKQSEGLRRALYKCPAGHATIGYGHLVHHGPPDGTEPSEFRTGISEGLAEYLLRQDLREAEQAVARAVKVPLEQHQFGALVSFVFNLGAGAFCRSTLLRSSMRATTTPCKGSSPAGCGPGRRGGSGSYRVWCGEGRQRRCCGAERGWTPLPRLGQADGQRRL